MGINEIILSRDIVNKIKNGDITHYISLKDGKNKELSKNVNYRIDLSFYGKIENSNGNSISGHLEPCFDLYNGEEYLDSFTNFMA